MIEEKNERVKEREMGPNREKLKLRTNIFKSCKKNRL